MCETILNLWLLWLQTLSYQLCSKSKVRTGVILFGQDDPKKAHKVARFPTFELFPYHSKRHFLVMKAPVPRVC